MDVVSVSLANLVRELDARSAALDSIESRLRDVEAQIAFDRLEDHADRITAIEAKLANLG